VGVQIICNAEREVPREPGEEDFVSIIVNVDVGMDVFAAMQEAENIMLARMPTFGLWGPVTMLENCEIGSIWPLPRGGGVDIG